MRSTSAVLVTSALTTTARRPSLTILSARASSSTMCEWPCTTTWAPASASARAAA